MALVVLSVIEQRYRAVMGALDGARPAGPPPRPRNEPVTVQRRVSATGVITVCRQQRRDRARARRAHRGGARLHHTLAIELDDETRAVRRTTNRPVVVIKASRIASSGNLKRFSSFWGL